MAVRIKCLACDFEQVFTGKGAMNARDVHEFGRLHPVVIQQRRGRRWYTLIGELTDEGWIEYTRPEDHGTTAEQISR